jgi:hypothetical protein
MSQLIVIVEVPAVRRDAEKHPSSDKRRYGVSRASRKQRVSRGDSPIGFIGSAEQQPPASEASVPPSNSATTGRPPAHPLTFVLPSVIAAGVNPNQRKPFTQNSSCQIRMPDAPLCLKNLD